MEFTFYPFYSTALGLLYLAINLYIGLILGRKINKAKFGAVLGLLLSLAPPFNLVFFAVLIYMRNKQKSHEVAS
ncbi:hypothetical protein [Vibrio parahaemolyticus]|uniref:hypothetical protein n=1 Tax=Vibrio parahaemolyticus TaxID=670 RepID=UPI00128EB0CC|nr:hypothetical protein [Vibrio parahaemolyticus]MCX8905261.1 hypothetical protein [Vibrio parahaemolyticus]MQF45465.1 hypothetical protein [Vibrio parahaemolyticus]